MGGRPDPDLIDVEPSRESVRPGQGYRVGARISVGDGGRRARQASAIGVAIIVAGLALSTLGPLGPAQPDRARETLASHAAASPLPNVAILEPPGTTRLVPVMAGGLRWLDPAYGTMSGDAFTAPRGSLFIDAEGRALCVCLEIPWSADRFITRVTLRRYSDGGDEVGRTELYELRAPKDVSLGEPIQVDAALAPDGRHLWLVRVVRGDAGWEVGVDRVDLASTTVDAGRLVDSIPAPDADAAGSLASDGGWTTHRRSVVWAALRVSPDGSSLAVIESVFSRPSLDPRLPTYQEQRLVIPSDLDPARPAVVVASAHDASADACDSQLSGWASEREFVTICARPEGPGIQQYLRIESPGEVPRELAAGPPLRVQPAEWLLDSRRGIVYGWLAQAHRLSRVDVRDGTVVTLDVDPYDRGFGDLGSWPVAAGNGASGSDGPGGGSPWTSLTGPNPFLAPPGMVGSADGTVIYALGFRSLGGSFDDSLASTGIWVFDAERAELVARWRPTALHRQIGYAPGWERLITLALPGSDGTGAATGWGTSIWFHDARTGEVTALLGDVRDESGFVPELLTPNAPGGIAGF